jgi:hypothetical protein
VVPRNCLDPPDAEGFLQGRYCCQAVDLSNPKAIQLRDEMKAARDAMLKASVDLARATEIAQDGAFRSYDGALGMHQAATHYRGSVEQYEKAMAAWIRHVQDS